jgi:hypothetical protein
MYKQVAAVSSTPGKTGTSFVTFGIQHVCNMLISYQNKNVGKAEGHMEEEAKAIPP